LTAPEAAIVLEEPLNKVLTLVLFGLLKKQIITLESAEPMKVSVNKPYRATDLADLRKRKASRQKAAQGLNSLIHDYEHPFLDKLEEQAKQPVAQIDFAKPMEAFVKHTAVRVSGFNLEETRDYYQKIIQRALTEAQSMGELPEWEKTVERNAEWILMSDKYPTVLNQPGRVYQPTWFRPVVIHSAGRGSGGSPSPSAPSSGPSYGGTTSFGDVAASFAGFTQNTMNNFASSITPGSLNLNTPSGVVNLGGADKFTGEVLKGLMESSGSSGGGSGGGSCACACAGCACACACAGGGR
jgi:hypothetical protein